MGRIKDLDVYGRNTLPTISRRHSDDQSGPRTAIAVSEHVVLAVAIIELKKKDESDDEANDWVS